MRKSTSLALLGLATSVAAAANGSESLCSSFQISNIDNVVFTNAPTYYPANATVNITNVFASIDASTLPAFCRVELTITTNTTANSSALTEVWLPDAWNGRALTFGNGGAGGGVSVQDLGYVAVEQSFAGISTNTGHDSTVFNASWAGPGNDNAIVDWAWRALHLSVVAGKEVIEQYYSTAANKSYYLGCSAGKLKSVQEFPEDFDGVVVGSPASWMTHLQSWSIHMNLNVQPANSSRFMSEDIWTNVIAPEVLRQCDELDGLADGIISEPRNCHFRPETLTCRPSQNTSTCLTSDQIGALRRIYADYYETNQTYVFGSYYPGGESGFYQGLVGPDQNSLALTFYQYMVVNDTNWQITDYNVSYLELADSINPGQDNAMNPNITAFVGPEHNGKLIHYVGWADQLITPGNSMHYYELAHEFINANSNLEIDDVYRLFMVPGMGHCDGGNGANSFGGAGQAAGNSPPLSLDPQHNILAAVVQWVEEGIAPENITAARYNDGNATNGLNYTRPLCKFPAYPRYISGDTSSADSFECV